MFHNLFSWKAIRDERRFIIDELLDLHDVCV